MAADRPRLSERRAGRARWTPRQEFDQRDLYPQHVRRMGRLYARGRRADAADACGKRAGMTVTKEAIEQRSNGRATTRLDVRECELFLLHEARLLDDGQFDDWLALFTADACYWVPSEPDQA